MDTRTHSSHGGEATAGEAHPGPADASHDTNDHAGHEAHGAGEGAAGQGGHGQHGGHGDHVAMFRRRFWWSLVLSLPVVVTAHMIQDWFGYHLDFPGDGLIGPALGTVIFLYGGWPFLTGGLGEARGRQPGMMLLIAMAITVAFGASAATSLGLFDLDFWWELAALITIMLLGHWQEMKAIGQARGALAALAELLPDEAEKVGEDGGLETVSLDLLVQGDVVLVRPGARVPADGEIVEGQAGLDESMVTGESRPVAKGPGDRVVAGTVATDSSVRVRVEAVGADTALAGIQRLVAEAQASRSRAQALADRFAALLFYVAAGAGVLTFGAWAALGTADDAVVRTVTVLVIACPHALGLAIPLVISLSTALAARAGILVKDRLALERMRTIDAVLFDKTGTLTKGAHAVTGVAGAGLSDDEVLALAGAVESDSEHPLARAIVAAAGRRAGRRPASEFRSITGRGVEATVDGTRYAVGGPALMRERQLGVPAELAGPTAEWERRGAAVLYLVRGDAVLGALSLEDEVRPEARQAVADLKAMGKRVVLITGDARQVADAVAAELGVDEVFAEVLPEDKDRVVVELQERGLSVAMVGDGVNDAPALARADVGLAIGAGTDVAIESAGVVLASNDPRGVTAVIKLSQASYRKMLQNLGWAAGYNVVAIPLAAGVLSWAGLTLPPAVGAVLMSASTVVVALNAQLLRRVDLRAGTDTSSGPRGSRPGGRIGRRRLAAGLATVVAVAVALGFSVRNNATDSGGGPSDHKEAAAVKGLSSSEQGYTLDVLTPSVEPQVPAEFRFRVLGVDGRAVTEYRDRHERPLHLIVASRDLTVFRHVHPALGGDGTWRIGLDPMLPGPYRVFADFAAADGPELTLGHDVVVPGEYRPEALPPELPTAIVDGYRVEMTGAPVAGGEGTVTLTVNRNGAPLTDLEPYLGALGHLVAIRSSDLAYLHVHPLQERSGPGEVAFSVDAPSAGTYRLFFDFSHQGTVRTAAFTVDVGPGQSAPPTTGGGGHSGRH
ncbi:MAG TPA: heavy metal translocating P-type ATPase [Acidimicrobiales bacterium]|nr:heavy metal translocating P-type ATPase [Acidimicrobiales bacterium]